MRQNEHIGPTCRKPFALCDGRHQGFECLGADRARLASACGASARASSDRLGANASFDDASSSGILPYEAGIERTTATTPEATKKQRQLPAIQVGKCAAAPIASEFRFLCCATTSILAPSPVGNRVPGTGCVEPSDVRCQRLSAKG